ncbi:kinase-like domain-containing protein [Flagelloscypha sp. PMI_526]|nr:kinase-like domain-containing protein [Flagelloscypha sp. PMI_526]
MSKDGQDVKHYDIATRASLKILLVDKVSTNEESPAGYKLGGYLPIKVSDSFKSGRYEVVRKLGWGHFSTVWLVKDTQAKRHSALKVVKSAPKYAEIARDEIKLLSRLSMASPSHPGRDHIVSFLDSFSHLGPQSSHICIVFEPMGETLLSLIERNKKMGVPLNLVKIITKQVLLGLQYLHDECDLVHTDIKPENILISIPNVEEYICNELLHPPPLKYGQVDPITNPESREGTPTPQNLEGSTQRVQIWESQPLRSPSLSFGSNTPGSSPSEVSENVDDTRNLPLPFKKPGTVSPTLGTIPPSPPATPAPQYVTPIIQPESPSTPVRPPYDTPLPSISVKIADLGNATPSQKHFSEDIQTRQYRAPECILGRKDWDTRVDVWSVACLVFELLTAEYLFDPQEYTELFTKDDDHMAQIIELIGDFPVEVKMGGKYSREIFDHTGALRYIKTLKPWPLHEVMNRKYGWSEVDSALFSNFALPMLAPDMHQRVHARDIINHPWLEVDPSTLGGGSTHPIPSKSGLDAEKPSQVRHHNSRPSSNYLPTTTTTTRQSRALTVLPRRHFHSRSSTTSCSRLRSSVSVSRSRTPAYQPSVSPNLTVSI